MENNQTSVAFEQVADYVVGQIVCDDDCNHPEHNHHHLH
jgi:histidyl-tRNA synthetase